MLPDYVAYHCNVIFLHFPDVIYQRYWINEKNMPERTMHFPKKETWKYYNIIWNSAPCCCVISCFPFYIFLYFSRSWKRKLRYSLPTLKIAAAYTSITQYNLSQFHQEKINFIRIRRYQYITKLFRFINILNDHIILRIKLYFDTFIINNF